MNLEYKGKIDSMNEDELRSELRFTNNKETKEILIQKGFVCQLFKKFTCCECSGTILTNSNRSTNIHLIK